MSKGKFMVCHHCDKRATHIHGHLIGASEISCDEHACQYCRPMTDKERLSATWRKNSPRGQQEAAARQSAKWFD